MTQVCFVWGSCMREKLTSWTETGFQFISIQNPEDTKDREKRRVARSHAVKQALRSKRRPQEGTLGSGIGASGQMLVPWSIFAPASAYGPFESIMGDSPRLRALISHSKLCLTVKFCDMGLTELPQPLLDMLPSPSLASQIRLSSKTSAPFSAQTLTTRPS